MCLSGRRKCAKGRKKAVTEAQEDASCDAPKKKDSRLSKEFQGKLSHASPQVKTPPITKFFSVQGCAVLIPDIKTKLNENVEREAPHLSVNIAVARRQCGDPAKSASTDGECQRCIHCYRSVDEFGNGSWCC
jgi:hypothetical protein